jgi:hypothetical protein
MSHLWIVEDIKKQIICCVGDSVIYQSKISKQIKKFENNMKSTVYPPYLNQKGYNLKSIKLNHQIS